MKVLSLGAGVNSTALLVLRSQGKVDFDLAVFADTGGEHPETYAYLDNVIRPFCEKHQIELVRVKSQKPPLYDFYFSKRIIPTRMFRHCTDHYKIQPLKKYCMDRFPTEKIVFLIGIDVGERNRAESFCKGDAIFPLIDMDINREECKEIILDAGLPLPIKSGCYFCPFTRKQGWLNLLKKHPDLFLKAEVLEQNCSRYPEMTLANVPLEKVRKEKQGQSSLCNFGMETCPLCEVE